MPSEDPTPYDPLFNTSLKKGLSVLFAFSGARRSMTLREVGESLGMTKSSAQRIIHTLEILGLVHRSPLSGKYQLTLRVMELGFNYLAGDSLVEAGSPFLSELTNVTGETTNLMEPEGVDMVYVSRVVSPKFIPMYLTIGSKIPMYCTASGRAYLSALPEEEMLSLVASFNFVRHTHWTKCDPKRVIALLKEAKRNGYAYNKEEYFIGDMTVAAPIMGGSGRPLGAIHIAAPTSRWTLEAACARLAPSVIEAARGISNAVRAAT